MARGYPDYGMSPVLPFAKVFATQACLVASVASMEYKEVYRITGKGQIESGYLILEDTIQPHLVSLYLWIDGAGMAAQSLSGLNYRAIYADTTWPFYLTRYDTSTPYYVISFRKEVFFGVSIVFGVNNLDAIDIDVSGELQYAHL